MIIILQAEKRMIIKFIPKILRRNKGKTQKFSLAIQLNKSGL